MMFFALLKMMLRHFVPRVVRCLPERSLRAVLANCPVTATPKRQGKQYRICCIVRYKEKKKRHQLCANAFWWCEKRDLNPYGESTRPSNVRVCQFRHSRIYSVACFTTDTIISPVIRFVNSFLKKYLILLINVKKIRRKQVLS